MYEVLLNDATLYYPANSEYVIFSTSLELEVGLAGEFKFDVPLSNPLYGQIGQGSIITILRNNKEYWRGEVKEVDISLDKTKNVYCLEDLSWLADESIAPANITNETYEQRFRTVIETYNSGRSIDKQFAIGYITNVVSTNNCTWKTEYGWSILHSLRKCICKDDGYLRVRREQTGSTVTRYIDIVKIEDYGVMATQPIIFGVNLLDYLQKMDLGNFTNAITPYGAELDEELYTEYNKRIVGTPIEDSVSVGLYGRHAKSVVFENVTNIDTLNALAQAYLTRYSKPQIRMELKAIDLAELSSENHFNIGDSIHIIADPFNIDQWVYLTKQTIDLQDASKNEITLSSYITRGGTITEQTIDTADLIKDIPSKASIVEAAKKNALDILNGENGGVIYFVSNDQNQIIEQVITNNLDLEQATKAWRWNLNGFAYMHRTYPSDPWTIGVAITMDGQIVADYITTGTLNANNVRVVGKIEATSGYIGTQYQGWNIGSKALYNGPSSINDTSTPGMYVGADGIRTNGTHLGHSGATTVLKSGYIESNSEIISNALTTRSANISNTLIAKSYTIGVNSDIGIINGRFNNKNGMTIQSCPDNHQFAFLHIEPNAWVPWTSASDRRLKENIKPIEIDFVRDLFVKVNPVSFNFKKDKDKKTEYGLIAQDLEEVFDELDITDENIIVELDGEEAYKAINYEKIIGLIIPAVKDLYAQINELKEEIKILKEERNG